MLATLKFSKLRQVISISLRLIQAVDSLRLIQYMSWPYVLGMVVDMY